MVFGENTRIEDAKLVFKTNFGEVPVPINTVEKMAVVNPFRKRVMLRDQFQRS